MNCKLEFGFKQKVDENSISIQPNKQIICSNCGSKISVIKIYRLEKFLIWISFIFLFLILPFDTDNAILYFIWIICIAVVRILPNLNSIYFCKFCFLPTNRNGKPII
jgi:hypothetical protein